MKDSLTLIALFLLCSTKIGSWHYFLLIMMPLSAFVARSLGKRMGKATTKSAISAA